MVLVGSRPVGCVLHTGSRDTRYGKCTKCYVNKRVIGSHSFANRASL